MSVLYMCQVKIFENEGANRTIEKPNDAAERTRINQSESIRQFMVDRI